MDPVDDTMKGKCAGSTQMEKHKFREISDFYSLLA